MASLAVDLSQTRLAASLLLLAYVVAAVILLPRELNFLRSVAKPYRTKFLTLDILLQVSILLVLLPPMLAPLDDLNSWLVVGVGFFGLWVAVAWIAISRYVYTYRYLIQHHDQVKGKITKLQRQIDPEDEACD